MQEKASYFFQQFLKLLYNQVLRAFLLIFLEGAEAPL